MAEYPQQQHREQAIAHRTHDAVHGDRLKLHKGKGTLDMRL